MKICTECEIKKEESEFRKLKATNRRKEGLTGKCIKCLREQDKGRTKGINQVCMDNTIEWRDIIGYEGYYKVSEQGDIYSIKNKKLRKPVLWSKNDPQCYYKITLSLNNNVEIKYVHRLVAEAFMDKPEGKTEVNHIDGNKLNNCLSNLEWVTRSENMKHAIRIGLRQDVKTYVRRGKDHPASKPIRLSRGGIILEFDSMQAAARETKNSYASLYKAVYGIGKNRKGWKIEFI